MNLDSAAVASGLRGCRFTPFVPCDPLPETDQMHVQGVLCLLSGQVTYEDMAGQAVREGEQGPGLALRIGHRTVVVGRTALASLRDEAAEEAMESRVTDS
jgi:hypothetical protein